MSIIAIDPGPTQSAWVVLSEGLPINHGKAPNADVLWRVRDVWQPADGPLAIEHFQGMGMPVGKEVFETCYFIGALREAWQSRHGIVKAVYRKDVKLFHCETVRANDSNIRQALIDRYGGSKEEAIGRKKAPGPLYGIVGDEWSALAIALTVEGRVTA